MPNRTAWNTLMDIYRLVDTAYGLAILADYDCADSLGIPAEQEAATHAPMSAARILLEQAKELVNNLEPVIRKLEERAA